MQDVSPLKKNLGIPFYRFPMINPEMSHEMIHGSVGKQLLNFIDLGDGLNAMLDCLLVLFTVIWPEQTEREQTGN